MKKLVKTNGYKEPMPAAALISIASSFGSISVTFFTAVINVLHEPQLRGSSGGEKVGDEVEPESEESKLPAPIEEASCIDEAVDGECLKLLALVDCHPVVLEEEISYEVNE